MTNLRKVYDECMTDMVKAIKSFPLENRHAYAAWLRDIYEYAEHSTRILAQTASNIPTKYNNISNRFIRHAAEETGHEKLVEKDLKALGFDVQQMEATTESKFFYQSLYYWLSKHANPLGIMGWILALEGAAVNAAPWAYSIVKEVHGKKAGYFLKVHGEEDPSHLEDAFKTIEKLDQADVDLVIKSLKQYSIQYVKILESIKSSTIHGVNNQAA
tara:strand:- start:5577 stop:6221 length:645 start_codon:yes stop_codon:yes gene_type:complete